MSDRASPAGPSSTGGGSVIRPDPDPTVLTTAALLREIGNLESRVMSRIDGIEKAVAVAHEDMVRVPTAVDKAVEQLRALTWGRFDTVDVKFHGITNQFTERDVRVEQTARDTKTAVDAALAAQEKAAGKQTDAFTKQIDALDDKISDIRDRQITSEGTGKGRGDVWGYVAALAGLLIALAAIFRGHI